MSCSSREQAATSSSSVNGWSGAGGNFNLIAAVTNTAVKQFVLGRNKSSAKPIVAGFRTGRDDNVVIELSCRAKTHLGVMGNLSFFLFWFSANLPTPMRWKADRMYNKLCKDCQVEKWGCLNYYAGTVKKSLFSAKKSLGQNFLRSKSALAKIAEAGDLKADDIVLEVGPGEGILTAELLKRAVKVIAVEKDDRLMPYLKEKFANEISTGKLTLIHEDILEFDSRFAIQDSRFKIVANIPYYITGALIRKFLEAENQPSLMVLLLQKEVAERIVAKKSKESLLSISVKAYGTPKFVAAVPAGSFSPAPKVDSAILAVTDISKKFFAGFSEERFFAILKTGFAHKRKKLAGNLKPLRPDIETAFEKSRIDKNIRPEDLSLADWRRLAMELL